MQRARSDWQESRRQSKAQTHNVLDPPIGKGRADRGEVRQMTKRIEGKERFNMDS